MSKKNRAGADDKCTRDLEQFIPAYIQDTGDQAWTTMKIAAWAIKNGRWEQQKTNAVKQLARELSRVARQVHLEDEHGNKVRKYHAFRLGHDQPMLWAGMESILRGQVDEAKTMRREKLAAGCVQLKLDLDYYNMHHNPGDPLLFDPNFTNDLADKEHSCEYDDSEPTDDEVGN